MSGYTVGEILIWLVLAAVLGFALGWIARELLLRARSRPAGAPEVRPPVPVAEPAPPVKQAPAKKTTAKKTAAKKTAAKKTAAKKTAAKKTAAKKTSAKKTTARKTPPAKKATPPQDADDT